MIDLIIFALIAIYFVYKLNNILGGHDYNHSEHYSRFGHAKPETASSTGHEEKIIQAKVTIPEDEAITSKDTNIVEALKSIRTFDPSFTEPDFLRNASIAFETIIEAYCKQDLITLESLLSKELYEFFSNLIATHKSKKHFVKQVIIAIKNSKITKAKIKGRIAKLFVKFESEQISFVEDEKGNIIEGDATLHLHKHDIWTFKRELDSEDNVWYLVAT